MMAWETEVFHWGLYSKAPFADIVYRFFDYKNDQNFAQFAS